MLEFWVDGACSGNGREDAKGGYGVVILDGETRQVYSKLCNNTTNNREELKAILFSLLLANGRECTIYSDSAYSINTLSQWAKSWESKGWIKSDKKVPENLDIIKPAYEYIKKYSNVKFVKVKGHSGIIYNELADKLARGQKNLAMSILEKIEE